jgi:UDP-N-acetylmuramate dehydrogenase
MQIQENILLAPYTTFKIGGAARCFCVVENQDDALEAFEFAKKHQLKTFVLGGGSNILVSDEGFEGLVIKVVNKGIEVLPELPPLTPPKIGGEKEGAIKMGGEEGTILLKVASGEIWDEVVKFAVQNNWWGIENLSHIPGSTGAIAVQNVGAYGQEASRVIESVTVFDKETGAIKNLKNADCGFAYRQSIFNSVDKGKYIIFSVHFLLQKNGKANLSYRDLKIRFNGKNPSLDEIRQAVIEIRDKKFPFPVEAKNGNAGSFFKNLILTEEKYCEVKIRVEKAFGKTAVDGLENKKIPSGDGKFKLPAAFLIDLCGLKNLQSGGAAINQNQPLVIVNQTGTATAKDVLNLANQVKSEVFAKTGIELKFEPELIGFD